MKRLTRFLLMMLIVASVALSSAAQKTTHKATTGGPSKEALNAITTDGVMAHIKTLSSDQFEGRAPGTRGEELSINYLADQFKKVGLEPGNTDSTYFQKVPLAGITTKQDADMKIKVGSKELRLKYKDDF